MTFGIVSLRSTRQWKWIPGSWPKDDTGVGVWGTRLPRRCAPRNDNESTNNGGLSFDKGEVRDCHTHFMGSQ